MTNPALDDLGVLLGTWDLVLSDAEWLEPDVRLGGSAEIGWLDDQLLVQRSSFEGDGMKPPTSTAVIGRNEDRDDYVMLYADERGVSRVFAMTFADGLWTLHREDPGFHQRFEGRVAADGSRIDATWSRSHDDGATWIHDFDLEHVRR